MQLELRQVLPQVHLKAVLVHLLKVVPALLKVALVRVLNHQVVALLQNLPAALRSLLPVVVLHRLFLTFVGPIPLMLSGKIGLM